MIVDLLTFMKTIREYIQQKVCVHTLHSYPEQFGLDKVFVRTRYIYFNPDQINNPICVHIRQSVNMPLM